MIIPKHGVGFSLLDLWVNMGNSINVTKNKSYEFVSLNSILEIPRYR